MSCLAAIVHIGSSAMALEVETFAARYRSGGTLKLTERPLTSLAIEENRKPRPVPRD